MGYFNCFSLFETDLILRKNMLKDLYIWAQNKILLLHP
jgi:hypothetical protein